MPPVWGLPLARGAYGICRPFSRIDGRGRRNATDRERTPVRRRIGAGEASARGCLVRFAADLGPLMVPMLVMAGLMMRAACCRRGLRARARRQAGLVR